MTYEEAIEKIKQIPQQWHYVDPSPNPKFSEIFINKTEILKALDAMDIYCFLYSHLPRFIDPMISKYIVPHFDYCDFKMGDLVKSGLNYILSFLRLDKPKIQRDIEDRNYWTLIYYKEFDPNNQTAAYKDPQYVNDDKLKTIFKIVDNIKKNQELLKVFACEVIFRYIEDLDILSVFTSVDRSKFDDETLEYLDNRYVELYQKYWRIDLKEFESFNGHCDPSFYDGIGGTYPSSVLQNKIIPIYQLAYDNPETNTPKKYLIREKIQIANYQINAYPDPADFVFPEKEMNAIPFPFNETNNEDTNYIEEILVNNRSDEGMMKVFSALSSFYDILKIYFPWYLHFPSIENNPAEKRITTIILDWFDDNISGFIDHMKYRQEDPKDNDDYKVYKDEVEYFINLVKNTQKRDINRLYTGYNKNTSIENLNVNVLADKIKRTFGGGYSLNTGIINYCLVYKLKDDLRDMTYDLFGEISSCIKNWLIINQESKQIIRTRYLIQYLDALGHCSYRRKYCEDYILGEICYYVLHIYEKEDKTEELIESIDKLLNNDQMDPDIYIYMGLLKKAILFTCDKEKYPLSAQDMNDYRVMEFPYGEPFILRGRSI